MAAKQLISKSSIIFGKVFPSVKENAAKIQIRKLELDERLLMYFSKDEFVFAHDPQKICKTGDLVLLKLLPVKFTKLITHEVLRVIYPLGDITDPVTGKKCAGRVYREDQDHQIELFGGRPSSAFDYEKAPPRGWQEDKRDLTHRESFIKWRDEGDDIKYSV